MKYTFKTLPRTLDEMKSLEESNLMLPENTVFLTIAALCVFPEDPNQSIAMLEFLRGPKLLSTFERKFMKERFESYGKHIACAYLIGATKENGFSPDKPYSIKIREANIDNSDDKSYRQYYISQFESDLNRTITLRQYETDGPWFLWDQVLLSGVGNSNDGK